MPGGTDGGVIFFILPSFGTRCLPGTSWPGVGVGGTPQSPRLPPGSSHSILPPRAQASRPQRGETAAYARLLVPALGYFLSVPFVALAVLTSSLTAFLVLLAGVHVGCFVLFATESVRTVRDLKGKTVGVTELGSGRHVFLASVMAWVGAPSPTLQQMPLTVIENGGLVLPSALT